MYTPISYPIISYLIFVSNKCILADSFQLSWCDVTWMIKDWYIGNTFFDASVSAFLMPTLADRIRRIGNGTVSTLSHATTSPCNEAGQHLNRAPGIPGIGVPGLPGVPGIGVERGMGVPGIGVERGMWVMGAAVGPDWVSKCQLDSLDGGIDAGSSPCNRGKLDVSEINILCRLLIWFVLCCVVLCCVVLCCGL